MVFAIVGKDDTEVKLTATPKIKDFGEGKVGVFFIGGYLYIIELAPTNNQGFFDTHYLKENGDLSIYVAKGPAAREMLRSFSFSNHFIDVFTNPVN